MASAKDIAAIQNLVANSLQASQLEAKFVAGVIGEGPSHYSKSPRIWNAAFRYLGIDGIYLPLDVEDAHVGPLLNLVRHSESILGINVTMPHKARVMDWLDEVDGDAARIRAVNTVVRTPAGKLLGYNTDGEGFIDSLLLPDPGQSESFIHSLDGVSVLLLGAGGSARAAAFHLSDRIGSGKLIIANRSREGAMSLARELKNFGRPAMAIDETEISVWAPRVSLIVNCTVKGQGGERKLANGAATSLESYSALAPAHPVEFSQSAIDREARWRASARADIEANNQASETLAQSIPKQTRFYDLIYHPEESVFLRHGRLTGHKTMNGKSMIVRQAVSALCKRICQRQLAELGADDPHTFGEIAAVMYRAWD